MERNKALGSQPLPARQARAAGPWQSNARERLRPLPPIPEPGWASGRKAAPALSLRPFELVQPPAGRPPGDQGTARGEK